MKKFLVGLFIAILLAMISVTVWASIERNMFQAGRGLWPDPWFLATLLDAYLGFLIFFVWVAHKERSSGSRILWFVLIMGLGNRAAAFYVLLRLGKMRSRDGWGKLLLREKS
jgi:hypothetical protein